MKTNEVLLKATDGIIRTLVDGSLFFIYLYGSSFGKRMTSQDMSKVFEEAYQLQQELNYDYFKRIISHLRKKGLIKVKKRKLTSLEIEITEDGRQKINQFIPNYHAKRTWDGYLYLVSYDIAEKMHSKRNMFRNYLIKLGCANLQESLWVAVYNPTLLISEFVEEKNVQGQVLVSKMGSDGSIGEENIYDLVRRVFKLDKLNEKYREYIDKMNLKQLKNISQYMSYFAILKNDPQLPFELLPDDWLGDIAYQVYCDKLHITCPAGHGIYT